MGQMTIMTGPERRRRWSDEDRLRILGEAFAPDANLSEVARRHDVSRGLIYLWRREAMRELTDPGFVPAVVADEPAPVIPEPIAVIMIDLPGGGRVSIAASAPPALAAAALKALR